MKSESTAEDLLGSAQNSNKTNVTRWFTSSQCFAHYRINWNGASRRKAKMLPSVALE